MKITFDGGEHTSADRIDLEPGELVRSVGAYYRPKDKRVHRIPGRTSFAATGTGTRVKGLQLAAFDDQTDKVLCFSGTAVYQSNAGTTGSFSTAKSGLTASAGHMIWAHANDKWYGVNGVDRNLCFEYVDLNDGSGYQFVTRDAGMLAPSAAPTVVPSLGTGTVVRPTATDSNTGWTAPGSCYDGDAATFAYAPFPALGVPAVLVVDTFADDGGTTGRYAVIRWRVTGQRPEDFERPEREEILGRFKVELYDNNAAAWTTLIDEIVNGPQPSWRDSVASIPDAVDIDNVAVQVRMTFTANVLVLADTQVEVSDVRAQNAANGPKLNGIDGGFFYVYTEFDEHRHLESGPSELSSRITIPDDTYNSCVLSGLPATPKNSNTTHYRIYRSYDDENVDTDNPPTSTSLDTFGLVRQIKADGATSFIDDFATSPKYQLPEGLNLAGVTDGVTWTWYVRDNPPPVGEYIVAYRGTLVISRGRGLYFLVPGRPESWIEGVSEVTSFPFEEHDQIICMQTTGESLFVFARGVVAVMDDIPRVTNGAASIPEIRTIKGQPGCVSRQGATAYSVTGEKRVAWVSRQGIHASDGDNAVNLVDEIDWAANVDVDALDTCSLEWLPALQCLKFGYDAGSGQNDRYALIHVFDPKRSTWGHYGAITAISAGETGGVYREYTGNEGGTVYLEGGTYDASNSYDGGSNIRFDIETGRIYAEDGGNERVYHLGLCKLLHTDGGGGQSVTVTVTAGFDANGESHNEAATVSINGQGGTEFLVDLAGEWFTFRIEYTGQAEFGISEIRGVARPMGRSGTTNA